jgi:CHAD domain-containing protein
LLLRKVQSTLGQLNDIALLTNVLTGYVQSGFAGARQERGIDFLLQNGRLTAATALVEARAAWRELSTAEAFWR